MHTSNTPFKFTLQRMKETLKESHAHALSLGSALTCLQDDFVLEVRRYVALCWPNPHSAASSCLELVQLMKEDCATKDGPTVVHDR